jgi:hypothetical protein
MSLKPMEIPPIPEETMLRLSTPQRYDLVRQSEPGSVRPDRVAFEFRYAVGVGSRARHYWNNVRPAERSARKSPRRPIRHRLRGQAGSPPIVFNMR